MTPRRTLYFPSSRCNPKIRFLKVTHWAPDLSTPSSAPWSPAAVLSRGQCKLRSSSAIRVASPTAAIRRFGCAAYGTPGRTRQHHLAGQAARPTCEAFGGGAEAGGRQRGSDRTDCRGRCGPALRHRQPPAEAAWPKPADTAAASPPETRFAEPAGLSAATGSNWSSRLRIRSCVVSIIDRVS